MPLAPEFAAMLAAAAEAGGPALEDLSPAEGREMYRAMRPAAPEIKVGEVREDQLSGPHGTIPVRIYTPAGTGPFPVLMNFHGGGWVIGDLETADGVSRLLCNAVGCVVVSVDYRLAPESPYPAAVDDCVAATCWAADNAAALGSNGKLAVTGESAGGNLAAVVAQRAAADGGPELCFQLLSYPVVDHDLSRQSYADNGEGYLLATSTMRWFWDQYCPAEQRDEATASPLKAATLAGLPPALVLTAEFDPLRDEGKAYADALQAAGVPTRYRCMPGLIHDFLATSAVLECSKPGFEEAVEALRGAFA
ncbi:MAG: alpha/beta hydrolase [Pseudomonadota bacterium]